MISHQILGLLNLDLVQRRHLNRLQNEIAFMNSFWAVPDSLHEVLNSLPVKTGVYKYGIWQESPGSGRITLFPTHQYGFFSCLATTMWTVLYMQSQGILPDDIVNQYSMDLFKEVRGSNTWHELFCKPSQEQISLFNNIESILSTPFDHRTQYQEVYENHLGEDWVSQYLRTYMTPSDEVMTTAKLFVREQSISSDTIAVYYRGTDKHTEVEPTPLSVYFRELDELIVALPRSRIIIQTDQLQVRDAFLDRYGERCGYITQLPVTAGSQAIHNIPQTSRARGESTKKLYAMCIALSKSRLLLTCTSNVGFFIALHMFVQGKKVIQLD